MEKKSTMWAFIEKKPKFRYKMERNERKLLWGFEGVEKGQENVDITLGSKKRTKKVYRKEFLARSRRLYRGAREEIKAWNLNRIFDRSQVVVPEHSRLPKSTKAVLSKPSTRRQTISCRLLLPLPCLWAKNHIMAAKKQRRREEKNFHATKAESTSKHVVLFMLWYFMWKIGSLLMLNRTRFIKLGDFCAVLGGAARPARLFPCYDCYLEAASYLAPAPAPNLISSGPVPWKFLTLSGSHTSSATRNARAPQVWRIIDWLSFFLFFLARLYIRTSFIFRYLRKIFIEEIALFKNRWHPPKNICFFIFLNCLLRVSKKNENFSRV